MKIATIVTVFFSLVIGLAIAMLIMTTIPFFLETETLEITMYNHVKALICDVPAWLFIAISVCCSIATFPFLYWVIKKDILKRGKKVTQ